MIEGKNYYKIFRNYSASRDNTWQIRFFFHSLFKIKTWLIKMNNWDLLNAGLTVLSEPKMQMVRKSIQAIRYNAGLAIIDRRTHALMRDYIFDLSCDIETIKRKFQHSPQQVYFISKLIENRLNQCGFRSDLFPDVADKEFLVRLKNEVTEIINNSSQKLNQATKKNSDIALQQYFDLPHLKRAKNAKEAQEFLEGTEMKNQFLSKQSSRRSTILILGVFGLVVNLIGSVIILFIIGPMAFYGYFLAFDEVMITEGVNQSIIGVLILSILVVLLSWAISIFFLWLGLKKNPEIIKLKRFRELAHKDLLSMDEWVKVKDKFGELSSKEYKSLIEERVAYLEPYIGDRDKILSSDKN